MGDWWWFNLRQNNEKPSNEMTEAIFDALHSFAAFVGIRSISSNDGLILRIGEGATLFDIHTARVYT
jgi:hypothetical protein